MVNLEVNHQVVVKKSFSEKHANIKEIKKA